MRVGTLFLGIAFDWEVLVWRVELGVILRVLLMTYRCRMTHVQSSWRPSRSVTSLFRGTNNTRICRRRVSNNGQKKANTCMEKLHNEKHLDLYSLPDICD